MLDKLTQEFGTALSQVMKDCDNKPTVQADDSNQSTQQHCSEMNAMSGVLSKTSTAAAPTLLGWSVSSIHSVPHDSTAK